MRSESLFFSLSLCSSENLLRLCDVAIIALFKNLLGSGLGSRLSFATTEFLNHLGDLTLVLAISLSSTKHLLRLCDIASITLLKSLLDRGLGSSLNFATTKFRNHLSGLALVFCLSLELGLGIEVWALSLVELKTGCDSGECNKCK